MSPARRVALEVLRAVHAQGVTLGEALARWRPPLTDSRDRALVTEVTTGCLRWRGAIDHLIEHAASRPIDKLDDVVLDILRLAVFQLLWLDRVPAAAVVYDSVELAKLAKRRSAAGLVNAVLRRVQRDGRDPLPRRPSSEDLRPESMTAWCQYLSVTLSHPRWIVDRLVARYGLASTEAWLQFNLETAPLCLSVPLRRVTIAEVLDALRAHGLAAQPSAWAADAVVVARGPLPRGTACVDACWLQDEASHLVGLVPHVLPGMRVLDCCAAPGGKARQMGEALGHQGLLVAGDVRPARVRLLHRTLTEGGLVPFAKVASFDASRPLPFSIPFDRVLLDAPCTGLGTLRRDPEIKWRRRAEDLVACARTQRAMLVGVAAHVAVGGVLTYATCSSEPEENELAISDFLAQHRGFVVERVDSVCLLDGRLVDDGGAFRSLPHVHRLEAFYAARLRRLR